MPVVVPKFLAILYLEVPLEIEASHELSFHCEPILFYFDSDQSQRWFGRSLGPEYHPYTVYQIYWSRELFLMPYAQHVFKHCNNTIENDVTNMRTIFISTKTLAVCDNIPNNRIHIYSLCLVFFFLFTPLFSSISARSLVQENNWMIGSPMPTPRFEVSAEALNGKIYVVGGVDKNEYLTDIVEVKKNKE
jgi:hypothetical protein